MGHSWGFIFFILGLAGSVILCLVWWCWGSPQEEEHLSQAETDSRQITIATGHTGKIPVAIKRLKKKEENLQYEKELDKYEAPIVKRRSRSKSNNAENPQNTRVENGKDENDKTNISFSHKLLLKSRDQGILTREEASKNIENNVRENKEPIDTKNLEMRENFLSKNDEFYDFIDRKESKRKLLQKQNEERLSELLDKKHIFSSSQTNYKTLDRKMNERSDVLNKVKPQLRTFPVVTIKSKPADPNQLPPITVPERAYKRRYSESTNKSKSNPTITKIINFVALTANESAPKFEAKPKIKKQETKPSNVDYPRKSEPPKKEKCYYTQPRIKKPEEGRENIIEEHIGTIEEFVLELSRAETVIETQHAVEEVDIRSPKVRELSPEPTVSTRRLSMDEPASTFQFSSYRRNVVTESLFVGNIYVGQEEKDGVENEKVDEGNEREETFCSWRDKFDKKTSS